MKRKAPAKRAARARETQIIRELCALSRNSWQNAKPCDYLPLEAELRRLQDARRTP